MCVMRALYLKVREMSSGVPTGDVLPTFGKALKLDGSRRDLEKRRPPKSDISWSGILGVPQHSSPRR